MLAPPGELAPPPQGNPGSATACNETEPEIITDFSSIILLQSIQGNVFTPVCQSFCSKGWGGGVWQTPPGRHPPGRHPQADTLLGRHPPGRRPLGRHSSGQTTPPADTPPPQADPTADGTHPTGMHSCILNLIHLFS